MEDNRQPTQTAEAPEVRNDLDQELFDAIGKGKKRRRRRRVITVIVILALVAGGIWAAVRYGKKKVSEQMGNMNPTSSVTSYTVDTGSVNTTVSGSGQLSDMDTEKIVLPKGVKVEEMLVHAGDTVAEGDLLAIVDRSSVITAMTDIQAKIRELDVKIRSAANDTVSLNITTGVAGRVKMVYAQAGDDVAACMAEHGALALVSMDGYMAMEFPAGELQEGEEVKIVRAEGKPVKGKVDSVVGDKAIILVPDNGPRMDEEVTVVNAAGEELGTGVLYIHNPLRITGYAGTVGSVRVQENSHVYAGNTLFRLTNTAYSVNYEAFLKERHQLEDDLMQLIHMSRAGAVTAPFTGTVSSVEWKDPNAPADTGSGSGGDSAGGYGGMTGLGGTSNYSGSSGSGSGTGSSSEETTGETALLTLSPDEEMSLTITVDETDILALAVGQDAQVTVNSIGDIFMGQVTEINRNASASSGVTSYSAVITMPKDPRMMSGMSAKAVVLIQGVAGAILIPEDALHQTRDAAFVYTSYNYETGEFGDAVPVVTGLSDGSMVEIVEGLSQGDTVYYTVVIDPWAMYYGSGGNASAGDAWVETAGGDIVIDEGALASDGDAAEADAAVSAAEDEMRELMDSVENAG